MAMAGDVMRSSSGVGSMSFTQAATRPASTASNKQAHRPHETNFERSSGMAGFREFKPHETNAASSQDSTYSISSSSGAVSVPSLLNSSNNVSQTTLDTDATSPISPKSNKDYVQKQYNWSQERSSGSLAVKRSNDRLRTPERQVNAPRHDLGLTSPMSIGTPASGMKRMASGAVKSMGNGIMDSPASVRTHRRADSESSTGSKASEAAAQLKMRLTYAMAKVQHGWEHRSIDEVEQLAAGLSPRTVTAASPNHANRELVSPRAAIYAAQRQTGLTANMPARSLFQESNHAAHSVHVADTSMSPPSKRRSGTYQSMSLSKPVSQLALAPSASIGSHSTPRKMTGHRPPPIVSTGNASGLSTTPPNYHTHTPSTPKSANRPGTLRTKTQTAQAEQEAMHALMLMGSPGNGGRFPDAQRRESQHSSALASPMHSTFGPRQALQYRSDSNDSIPSSSGDSRVSSTGPLDRHDRAAMLQHIEMES